MITGLYFFPPTSLLSEYLYCNIKIMCPLVVLVRVTTDSSNHMKTIHHSFFYIRLMWGKRDTETLFLPLRHTCAHRHKRSTHTRLGLYKLSIIHIVIIQPCHRQTPLLLSLSSLSFRFSLLLSLVRATRARTGAHTQVERLMNHKSYECHLKTAQRYEKER